MNHAIRVSHVCNYAYAEPKRPLKYLLCTQKYTTNTCMLWSPVNWFPAPLYDQIRVSYQSEPIPTLLTLPICYPTHVTGRRSVGSFLVIFHPWTYGSASNSTQAKMAHKIGPALSLLYPILLSLPFPLAQAFHCQNYWADQRFQHYRFGAAVKLGPMEVRLTSAITGHRLGLTPASLW